MTRENSKPLADEASLERPRDRIVACAQDLFHRRGIRGVGVETIAEAAGTNKMTLYRHFGSKDDLILEYLTCKARKADEAWAEVEAAKPGDAVGQLLGYVEWTARSIEADDRGCDLANAAVELTEGDHPGLKLIETFKARQRERLTALCAAAGAAFPSLLADALVLLIEGARVSRLSVGSGGPSASLVEASEAMIAAFGVPARPADTGRAAADEPK